MKLVDLLTADAVADARFAALDSQPFLVPPVRALVAACRAGGGWPHARDPPTSPPPARAPRPPPTGPARPPPPPCRAGIPFPSGPPAPKQEDHLFHPHPFM